MKHPRHEPGIEADGSASREPSGPSRMAARLGLTVHGLLGVPYLLSPLLAPFWAAVTLWTVWTGLLAAAIWLRRTRPILVASTPVISLMIWVAALWAGSAFLSWAATG